MTAADVDQDATTEDEAATMRSLERIGYDFTPAVNGWDWHSPGDSFGHCQTLASAVARANTHARAAGQR